MLTSFIFAAKIFYSKDKKSLITFVVCSIIEIPLLLCELFYTKHFVDTIQNSAKNFAYKYILINMIILIAIIYITGILSSLKALCQTMIEEVSLFQKERMIIEKTLKLSILSLDSPNIKSLREKAMKLQLHNLLFEMLFFLSDALKILLLIFVLLYYKLYFLIFLIIILISLQLLINKYAAAKVEKINQSQIPLKRLGNYLFSLLVNRENIQEVKILEVYTYLKNKLDIIFNKNLLEIQKTLIYTELIKISLSLFYLLVNIAVITVLILSTAADIKSGGQFILLYQIVNILFSLIPSLSSHYSNITKCTIQYKDFIKYLKLEEESLYLCFKNMTSIIENNNLVEQNTGLDIIINNLSFSYPNSNVPTLKNINLNIKAREKIALVGSNGCGKSTLVKIIIGLYKPSTGNINYSLNGNLLPNNAIGNEIQVVFQDYVKLLRPIRENVALGNIKEINNDSKLFQVLKKADATQYSESLDTLLGPEFGGLDLSGGQWQKLAIARAHIKEGSLLIYDEATSALDPVSELKAFNSFLSLAHNKTSIIVTHRLSMTKFVDKIAVIDKGEIVEFGTHEELLKLNNIYTKMYYAQSSIYNL